MATTTVVTATGRAMITGRLQGSTPTQAEFKNIGWGTNPANLTAANTDVAPFTEAAEARVGGSSSAVTTSTTQDTYQVTGTITSASGQTIGEMFLSDTTSKPTAVDAVQTGSGVIGSNSSTSLTVASGANFAVNEYIQVRSEVMKITGISTNTLTVTRAQNGTTAISTIAANDVVTGGNVPGGSAVSNGNLALHSSFTGLALNTNDSISFTAKIQFS